MTTSDTWSTSRLNENFIKNEEIAAEKDLKIHRRTAESGEIFFHFISIDYEILCKFEDVKIKTKKDQVKIEINNLPKGLAEELKKNDIIKTGLTKRKKYIV